MTPLMKKLIAESIGTFCFVFAGTGAIVINDVTRGSVVSIAMTFGLIVMTMIYTLGDISGAHLNPAVTFGFLAALRFQGRLVLPYILSQLSGAILASLTLRCLFHEHATLGPPCRQGRPCNLFPGSNSYLHRHVCYSQRLRFKLPRSLLKRNVRRQLTNLTWTYPELCR